MDMTKNLSEAAKSALLAARSSRQGEAVPAAKGSPLFVELFDADAISLGGNLTRRGGIVRDKIVTENLDKAFG